MTDPSPDPAPPADLFVPPARLPVPPFEAPAGPPALVDAWPGAAPFALDGAAERAGWSPLVQAVVVFVAAFVLFQVVGGVVVAAGPAWEAAQTGTMPDAEALAADLLTERPRLVLGGNALGQAVAFGLFSLLAARWASRRGWRAFLRLRAPEPGGLALAALGWAALYPVVLFLGDLNGRLPLPPVFDQLDTARADMLERLLLGDGATTGFLLLTVALAPALFEELLFRGYLMRQAERRWGIAAAIIATGVFFGAYHLSLAQLVPLSVLGVYLGFVVWATGSVWTGVLVHLLNNGLAVVVAGYARTRPEIDLESMEALGVPWYFGAAMAVAGALAVWSLARTMLARRHARTDGRPDAHPAEASSLPAAPLAAVPFPSDPSLS